MTRALQAKLLRGLGTTASLRPLLKGLTSKTNIGSGPRMTPNSFALPHGLHLLLVGLNLSVKVYALAIRTSTARLGQVQGWGSGI